MAFPVSCVNSVNMSALPQLAAISRERAGDSVRPTKSPALKPILVLSAPKLDAVELASINTIVLTSSKLQKKSISKIIFSFF